MIYHLITRNFNNRIYFIEAKQFNTSELLVRSSVQMLHLSTNANTSGNMANKNTRIGSTFLASLPCRNLFNCIVTTITFFCCFFVHIALAQNDSIAIYKKGGADRFEITAKLDFTGLINPFKNSTGIVSDFRLSQKWSLEATLGSYFHSSTSSPLSGETYPGLKTAIGFKNWISPKKIPSMYWGIFLGGNYIVNKKYRDIIRQNQFTQITLVKRIILSGSLDARFGFQWHMGEQKRFIIDYFFGLGVLAYHVGIKSPIEGEVTDDFRDFFDVELPEGSGFLPHGYLLGLNVGYVIR